MTTGGRIFRSILATEDQSSATIARITGKMHVLNTATAAVAVRLNEVARSQIGVTKSMDGATDVTKANMASIQLLGRNLQNLSNQGVITASTLKRMSQQATLLSQTVGNEILGESLQQTRRELEILSPTMLKAEEQAQATGVKFKFMGDVSETTQLQFRRLSAASQGVLLGMSALQGNVLGVAFSLIFLQFSGFLRLSLGIAAATAIFIPFLRRFKEFLDRRREVDNLTNSLFIVTESLQSFVLAESVAEKLSKALGLTGGEADLFERAILQAIIALRKIGEEPTDQKLKIFTAAFAIARAEGLDFEKAMAAAFKALQESGDGFVTVQTGAGDTSISLEELEKRGIAALQRLTQGTIVPVETARRLISSLPESGREAFEDLVRETETGFVDLERVLELFPEAERIAIRNVFKILEKDTDVSLEIVEKRWEKAFLENIPAALQNAASKEIPKGVRDVINALDPIERKLRAIETLMNIVFESQRSNTGGPSIITDPPPKRKDPITDLPIVIAGLPITGGGNPVLALAMTGRTPVSSLSISVNVGTLVGEILAPVLIDNPDLRSHVMYQ